VRDLQPSDYSGHGLIEEKSSVLKRFDDRIKELFPSRKALILFPAGDLEGGIHVAYSSDLEETFVPSADSIIDVLNQRIVW
jgi:hypothetical protein